MKLSRIMGKINLIIYIMGEETLKAKEIKELSQLRDEGTISEEEFVTAKKNLLGGSGKEGKGEVKKKSKFKTVLIVVGILFLIGIIGGALGDDEENPAKDTPANQEEVVEEEEIEPEYLEVNIKSFLEEYDKNKLAAQEKYTGTLVKTTGYVSNISSALGSIYVSIEQARDSFLDNSITCYPRPEIEDKVLELENGQQITVRGKVKDMSFMSVGLKDCEIVE